MTAEIIKFPVINHRFVRNRVQNDLNLSPEMELPEPTNMSLGEIAAYVESDFRNHIFNYLPDGKNILPSRIKEAGGKISRHNPENEIGEYVQPESRILLESYDFYNFHISLSGDLDVLSDNFLMAVSYGHHVLHYPTAHKNGKTLVVPQLPCTDDVKTQNAHIEAQIFAYTLLFPEETFAEKWTEHGGIIGRRKIAEFFQTPVQAIIERAIQLELVNYSS